MFFVELGVVALIWAEGVCMVVHMDAEVAKRVMGWVARDGVWWWWMEPRFLVAEWRPSTDRECAMVVLDRVKEKFLEGRFVEVLGVRSGGSDPGWACMRATPMEICKTALEVFRI